jgi:hypothetical protein
VGEKNCSSYKEPFKSSFVSSFSFLKNQPEVIFKKSDIRPTLELFSLQGITGKCEGFRVLGFRVSLNL